MTELSKQRIESIEAEMDSLGVRDIYDMMVADGQHPNMAAMLASRQVPYSKNTDSDFCRRENQRMSSMSETELFKINDLARKAGINTSGKTYNGQLGKYTDPMAWVSSTSDVRQVAMAKGMDIDGVVKVNGYRGPKNKTKIAPDILNRLESQARKKDPSLDRKCAADKKARQELRESLVSKHKK